MRRKVYKVKVKIQFETTMDHSQTSMERAKQDVEKLINDYLKQGLDIRKIFEKPPRLIFKVETHNGTRI